jgi:predicted transcriptional regulator of viral defense system
MNTGLVALIFTMLVIVAIVSQVLWYRRDMYRVVTALKSGGLFKGLTLVKKHGVSRTYVYLILSDLERRGYVQRLGDRPPYLYRWRQK